MIGAGLTPTTVANSILRRAFSTGAMDAASETLKVVATTALGFLFGRNSK